MGISAACALATRRGQQSAAPGCPPGTRELHFCKEAAVRWRYLTVLLAVVPLLAATLASGAVTGSPSPSQLYGHLTSNRTLTVASPGPVYEVIGDFTIDPGATLTIERGVRVTATPYSDFLASGQDPTSVEINVAGSLIVPAGPDSVVFESPTGTSIAWFGIHVLPTGTVAISDVFIRNCTYGLWAPSGGTVTAARCTIANTGTGIGMSGSFNPPVLGLATLDSCTILSAASIGIDFASYTLSYSLRGCRISDAPVGVSLQGSTPPAPSDSLAPRPNIVARCDRGVVAWDSAPVERFVVHDCDTGIWCFLNEHINYCTVADNTNGIVEYGNEAGEVTNSIVTSTRFNCAGLAGHGTVHHSDVWGYNGRNGNSFGNFVLGYPMSSFDPFFVVGDADYHLSPSSFFTNYSVSGGEAGAYGPGPASPLPVASASVVSADGSSGVVRIGWYVGPAGLKATVLRRVGGSDWEPCAVLFSGDDGVATLEDDAVTSGTTYGYAVGTLSNGQIGMDGQVSVTVESPAGVDPQAKVTTLSRLTVSPNPAPNGWRVSFASPTNESTTIDVLDVTGRLVEHLDISSTTTGENSTYFSAQALKTGVYWIRVRQAGHELLARAVKLD
jgi:Right handed beta helix region/Secretion system C-terminal sorting domain